MWEIPLILVVASIIIILMERVENKKFNDILFFICFFPSFYIALSLGLMFSLLTENNIGLGIDDWYVRLLIEWMFLLRIGVFPEGSYTVRLLGWLLGFHIAFIILYLPRSTFFKRKEAQEFVEKFLILSIGIFDGVLIGGVVGLIALPIAILSYRIIKYVMVLPEKVVEGRDIKNIKDALKYIGQVYLFSLFCTLITMIFSLIIGPMVNIRSPAGFRETIGEIDDNIKCVVVGIVFGLLGGIGSIIGSTLLAFVGWYGYIKNVMPYATVESTLRGGKDIVGPVGGVIGALIGLVLGSTIEFTVRQWKTLKEKMRQLALKEKRAKLKAISPLILKKIVELGAFDIVEADRNNIPSDAIVALYGVGVLDNIAGKFYTINEKNLRDFIEKFSEIRQLLDKTRRIVKIDISDRTSEYLGTLGIKNLALIIFDPRKGPIPTCTTRYTRFSGRLFSDPTIPVTLSNISRTVKEATMYDAKLILRTYKTRYHGRDLFHIICAEIVETVDMSKIDRLMDIIAEILEKKGSIDSSAFKKAVEQAIRRIRRIFKGHKR